jgi:hypothetical protein
VTVEADFVALDWLAAHCNANGTLRPAAGSSSVTLMVP